MVPTDPAINSQTRSDNFLVGFHEERTEEPWDHPMVAYWKNLG